ncbi:PQQ-dependent sugar dehydrogenase [Nocardioides sp. GXQ0305]|uniref:PQQ-dependent sugar dehydrogenase n=1 Tax=Nocardioides sp. GXQ0305 TaxID=3423912 RepID=UPI003D7E6CE6
MRRTAVQGLGLSLGLALVLGLGACSGDGDDGPGPDTVTAPTDEGSPSDPSSPPSGSPSPRGPSAGPGEGRTVKVVDTVATGLEVPWGLGFLPDGRAVVTERDTREVLVVDPDGGDPQTVGVVEQAVPEGEGGLLGVAVSPDFARDRMLYFYATRASDNAVLRARLGRDDRLGSLETVLDGIPKGFIHNGGRLRFGPDGYLYVSTGETGDGAQSQDRSSLGGKILRITPDGDPAPGNPDPDSPVWTWGHRNVQGLAFDDGDRLWASEFGQSTYDELNLVRKGRNYGWPEVEGRGDAGEFVNPLVVWSTSEASPSGIAWTEDHVWMAALGGTRLWRVTTDGPRAGDPTPFLVGDYGRLRTVEVAPDGMLWVTTSNRDGRGAPSGDDDRILVVRPGSR